MSTLDWERVERYRDRTFRRRASRRVKGEKSALRFLDAVGFATAFYKNVNLPCLWVAICGRRNPRLPVHTHHDYAIGLTWDLKDSLPTKKKIFYGRVFRKKPSFISLRFLPHFYRLLGPPAREEGFSGSELGATARAILERLEERSPQTTAQLRMYAGHGYRVRKSRFEAAMAQLQNCFLVVRAETLYEPKFTYVWELFERWLPGTRRRAARLSRSEAFHAILRKYFRVVGAARLDQLRSLCRFPAPDVRLHLRELIQEGFVCSPVRFKNKAGSWIVLGELLRKMT